MPSAWVERQLWVSAGLGKEMRAKGEITRELSSAVKRAHDGWSGGHRNCVRWSLEDPRPVPESASRALSRGPRAGGRFASMSEIVGRRTRLLRVWPLLRV